MDTRLVKEWFSRNIERMQAAYLENNGVLNTWYRNSKQSRQISRLMSAIYLREVEIVRYLIELGIKITQSDFYIVFEEINFNIEDIDAYQKLEIIAHLLLETGKVIVDRRIISKMKNGAGFKNYSESFVYDMLQKDATGEIPLIQATRLLNIKKISELLNEFADVNEKNTDGETPLLCMFETYNEEKANIVFQLLIQKGADITATSNIGDNILQSVVRMHYNDIFKILETHASFEELLSGSNVLEGNIKIYQVVSNWPVQEKFQILADINSVLAWAVQMRIPKNELQKLIDANARIGYGKINTKSNAFHACAGSQSFEYVEMLKNAGVEINTPVPTPLMLLSTFDESIEGVIETMEEFLKIGADPNIASEGYETALMICAKKKDIGKTKLLLKYFANPLLVTSFGGTAYDKLFETGSFANDLAKVAYVLFKLGGKELRNINRFGLTQRTLIDQFQKATFNEMVNSLKFKHIAWVSCIRHYESTLDQIPPPIIEEMLKFFNLVTNRWVQFYFGIRMAIRKLEYIARIPNAHSLVPLTVEEIQSIPSKFIQSSAKRQRFRTLNRNITLNVMKSS